MGSPTIKELREAYNNQNDCHNENAIIDAKQIKQMIKDAGIKTSDLAFRESKKYGYDNKENQIIYFLDECENNY